MKTVYLAGLISTDFKESLLWREHVEPAFLGSGMQVLSPMRGKKTLDVFSKDGGVTDPWLSAKDIIFRDYGDVSQADVILAHLETFGSPRPLIGTVCELAWAWQLKKPVVAIAAEDNYLMRKHPFIAECVAHYCDKLEEAVDFTVHYYGR